MPSKIKIYKNDPTAGAADGTEVSSSTGLEPIESGAIKVPTTGYAEGSWVKLALRCDAGYETILDESRHALLEIQDSTAVDKWQLAPDVADNPGTPEAWGDPLTITDAIIEQNYIVWVRARVAHTEEPANDVSVDIKVTATIGAV